MRLRWGELRELAAGRADLLAEVAGIFEGASEGELGEPAAQLCRDAGADPDAIPAWVEEGRRRRAAAGLSPFSAATRRRPRRSDRCRSPLPRRCSANVRGPGARARLAAIRIRMCLAVTDTDRVRGRG
jgi:hypothetical protein